MKYNSPQFEVRMFLSRPVYVLIQTVQPEIFFKLYMLKKHKEHIKDYTVLPVSVKNKMANNIYGKDTQSTLYSMLNS